MTSLKISTSTPNEILTVSLKAADSSALFKGVLEEVRAQGDDGFREVLETQPYPIDNYPTEVLRKVFDFMEYHADNPMAPIPAPINSDFEKDLSEYDRQYIGGLPMSGEVPVSITKLLEVANYLTIPNLLDLLCAKVASVILATADNKPLFQETFNLPSTLTETEEQEIEEAFKKFYKN